MPLYISTTGATGGNLFASLERLSDGAFWNATTSAWAVAPAAADRKVPLTEGTGANAGSYSAEVTGLGDAGYVFVRVHDDDDASDAVVSGGQVYVWGGEEADAPGGGGAGGGGSGVVVSTTELDGLIQLPAVVIVVPDDADYVFQVESDDDLTGLPLRLTVREDPDWSTRYKTLITDDRRKWLEEDLSAWDVVFSSTTTTDPATGYAAAIVVPRADMALLSPGRYRYVLQVSNTTSGAYAPVVYPTWVSVLSNADAGAA